MLQEDKQNANSYVCTYVNVCMVRETKIFRYFLFTPSYGLENSTANQILLV